MENGEILWYMHKAAGNQVIETMGYTSMASIVYASV